MADRLFSRIKTRAFSWRPARSSMVMGLASPRSVRSAAMAGGRDLSASAARASVGKAALMPAAREPVCRKLRREITKTRRMEGAFCKWQMDRQERLGFEDLVPPNFVKVL